MLWCAVPYCTCASVYLDFPQTFPRDSRTNIVLFRAVNSTDDLINALEAVDFINHTYQMNIGEYSYQPLKSLEKNWTCILNTSSCMKDCRLSVKVREGRRTLCRNYHRCSISPESIILSCSPIHSHFHE